MFTINCYDGMGRQTNTYTATASTVDAMVARLVASARYARLWVLNGCDATLVDAEWYAERAA